MLEVMPIEILNTGHVTNCYLYYNENREAILVDAPDKPDVILNKINELKLDLKYILLTHAHADHTMALAELQRNTNAQVIANEKEKDTLSGKIQDYSIVFGANQVSRNIENIKFVNDGEIINLGEVKINVIASPGHTSGSTCYYIEKENILFTGDAIFADCVGRWDLETASIEDTVDTIVKLYKMFKSLNTKIYPGHGKYGIGIKETYFPVSRIIFNNTGVDLSMLEIGEKNESF